MSAWTAMKTDPDHVRAFPLTHSPLARGIRSVQWRLPSGVICGVLVLAVLAHGGMPLHAQDVMSFEEYQRVDHFEPYVYRLQTDSGALLYFGSRHSFDPADPQMDELAAAWNAFEPDIAYTEGVSVAGDSLSRDEFVRRYGEVGLTWWLAAGDGVAVHSLDPSREAEVGFLRAEGWSDEQLMLFYTLRHVAQPQNQLTREELADVLPRYLQSLASRFGLRGPKTLAEFEEAAGRLLPGVRDWTQIPISHFYPGPQQESFFTNEISTASNQFRDRHHVEILTKAVRSGRRVFAIAGSAHAVMQEPALRGRLMDHEWTLVWSDEFDQDGRPDPSNWTYETGFRRNRELQWYQPENAWCEDGRLVIEARRERRPNPTYEAESGEWRETRPFAEYTSASLTTRGLHSWKYGRFEMRGRIDTRPGLWPAFWTLGLSGEWPAGGEIDIMEYYRGMLLANVAWGSDERWVATWDDVRKPISAFDDPNWSDKFHVWRMEWDEESIRLYVDGLLLNMTELSETTSPRDEGRHPFRQPHYILLNLAVGGTNGGDPSTTAFPARFEVDYVRIYQQK